ncbi:MAG: RNA polymerase sigma factor [Ginsengibacter sp.]
MIDEKPNDLLPDIELFVALCKNPSDEDSYNEFVRRFLPDVVEECKRKCRYNRVDWQTGREIAHQALENARKSASFKEPENLKDPRKAILVYLFAIVTNLFNDHFRKKKRQQELQTTNHKTYFQNLIETSQYENDPEKLQNVRDNALFIFNKLSKKEKTVVLRDIEYKKHHLYLPHDVTEQLADELGIKKASIRKIRQRASDKIKKAINEINQ